MSEKLNLREKLHIGEKRTGGEKPRMSKKLKKGIIIAACAVGVCGAVWGGLTIARNAQRFIATQLPEENYRACMLDGSRTGEKAMHPTAITAAPLALSSAPVGSSASSSLGLPTMARAMATRWHCPPDSWSER